MNNSFVIIRKYEPNTFTKKGIKDYFETNYTFCENIYSDTI